jgi:hypothetical protein
VYISVCLFCTTLRPQKATPRILDWVHPRVTTFRLLLYSPSTSDLYHVVQMMCAGEDYQAIITANIHVNRRAWGRGRCIVWFWQLHTRAPQHCIQLWSAQSSHWLVQVSMASQCYTWSKNTYHTTPLHAEPALSSIALKTVRQHYIKHKAYFLFLCICLEYFGSSKYLRSGPGSSLGIATDYGLNGPGIESQWGRDLPHLSRLALGPTQPPVQWVPALSRG